MNFDFDPEPGEDFDDMDQEPSEEMIAEWEHEEAIADMQNTDEEPFVSILNVVRKNMDLMIPILL